MRSYRIWETTKVATGTVKWFLAETNSTPKPFVWTADPKRVLAAVKRGKEASESIH